MNAVIDALWREYHIDTVEMPATPERVWVAISEHEKRHRL
jgi:carbon-monoxide dehydrogenase large subunit